MPIRFVMNNSTCLIVCVHRPGCFPIRIPQPDPVFPPVRTCMNFVRALPTPNLQCTLGNKDMLTLWANK